MNECEFIFVSMNILNCVWNEFFRCGFLIALLVVLLQEETRDSNDREKIDLSGRLTLIFRMLWQETFLQRKTTQRLCWSNKSLIGEMARSEFHSLFKFKCHVSVSFESSLAFYILHWFEATLFDLLFVLDSLYNLSIPDSNWIWND